MTEVTTDQFRSAYIYLDGLLRDLFGDMATIDKDMNRLDTVIGYLCKTYPDLSDEDMNTLNTDELAFRFIGTKMRDAFGLMKMTLDRDNCNVSSQQIET